MPAAINQGTVSSMSSVIGSIDNDGQVYRWFLILISLPGIRQKLCLQHKTNQAYQILKKIQLTETAVYAVLTLITLIFCFKKQPWILLWTGIPLVMLVNLFRKNRRCVAAISEQFLLENVDPDQLKKQTLYQTSEYLSQQYSIPSLVDIITYQDFIARKVLLATVLFLPFIFAFKTWQIWFFTIIILLGTIAIVNTSYVLRRLK